LLDVGGGIGAIAHEMLESGVSRAMIVDGSPSYLAAAREESGRRATGERLQFRSGDLVEVAADVSCADVVTLDKVVCCYPDMESLLAVSAVRANRLFGIVYPRDSWWVRLGIALENRLRKFQGSAFRNFMHPNAAIDAALHRAGLVMRFQHRGGWWVARIYERRTLSKA
jgi:magnesium-protoporphyrin O-methyltransferase